MLNSIDTALLQRLSEYALQTYTTPDSAVSELNHAQISLPRLYTVVCFMMHNRSRKQRKR